MKHAIHGLLIGTVLFLVVWALEVLEERTYHKAIEPSTFGLPCRLPDLGTEYRIIIQTRNANGGLDQTCSIEPIDLNEGRYKTMQRLLKRQRP